MESKPASSPQCAKLGPIHKSVGLPNSKTGQILERCNSESELRNTYLLEIGAEICQRRKTPQGDGKGEGVGTEGYVLDDVLDKVVQAADKSVHLVLESDGTVRLTSVRANDWSESVLPSSKRRP